MDSTILLTSSKKRSPTLIRKSKEKFENFRVLTTVIKTVDTLVFKAKTSSYITLSKTGSEVNVIPFSAGFASGLNLTN